MKKTIMGFTTALMFTVGITASEAGLHADVPDFSVVDVLVTPKSMHWALPEKLSCVCLLIVNGANGVQRNAQFETEDSLFISLRDEQGRLLPDGDYRYQLISMTDQYLWEMRAALTVQDQARLEKLRSEMIDRAAVKRGSFAVENGKFLGA